MVDNRTKKLHPLVRAVGTVLFIGYVSWTVGTAIWKNYQTNQRIDALNDDIAVLQSDIADLEDLIIYYQTDSFKEVEARRRLGLKGKDEEVVILPKQDEQVVTSEETEDSQTDTSSTTTDSRSNIAKWWDFIF